VEEESIAKSQALRAQLDAAEAKAKELERLNATQQTIVEEESIAKSQALRAQLDAAEAKAKELERLNATQQTIVEEESIAKSQALRAQLDAAEAKAKELERLNATQQTIVEEESIVINEGSPLQRSPEEKEPEAEVVVGCAEKPAEQPASDDPPTDHTVKEAVVAEDQQGSHSSAPSTSVAPPSVLENVVYTEAQVDTAKPAVAATVHDTEPAEPGAATATSNSNTNLTAAPSTATPAGSAQPEEKESLVSVPQVEENGSSNPTPPTKEVKQSERQTRSETRQDKQRIKEKEAEQRAPTNLGFSGTTKRNTLSSVDEEPAEGKATTAQAR
jgi:hypothetical protein